MSRCFPFPPPGYEKEARSDDTDLLTKEKKKEKKHKKEKKDREKKEGKEKKDKDRSKDKHREKKDRKEKHKDKKKDKDREKDKNKTSDEKRNEGKPEGHNEAKLGTNCQRAEELEDSKFTEELGRRIRDEATGTGKMVESISGTDQRRMEGIGRALEKDIEKRAEAKEKNKVKGGDDRRRDGHKEERDGRRGAGNQIFQNIPGTDRRIEGMGRPTEKVGNQFSQNITGTDQRTEGMGRQTEKDGNQIFQNITGTDQRRIEGMGRPAEKVGNQFFQNNTGTDQKKIEGMGKPTEKDGNQIFQNNIGTHQRKIEGMGRPPEKEAEKRIEKKEKHKDREGSDKKGDKHKKRDREEKRSKGKEKDRDKEKEKEKEKVKEQGEHKHTEDKIRESGKGQVETTLNIKPSGLPPKESEKSTGAEGNLKKRKGFETNGFIHENEMRPNKLARPASSSHPPLENGRKIESCHIATQCAPDRQGAATDSRKAEINKEQQQQQQQQQHHKLNGIIEAQPSAAVSRPSVSIEASENGEASTRPPHPDSKYLSQILAVPKMAEWSDFDDQEWLFGGDSLCSKSKAVASDVLSKTPQVWAEALRIESADVYALPYVIPY
ncbi:uncharacterized protein LOC131239602 [Magnolia sinica]|uniref:uncharacterized protein LOC131239602 n=1 Tax=Magnolia sinica TaxID=86752 RepID=UPI002659A3CC|nr:uncharacterized protein LOC131239602 [Magnolia sinica]